MKKILGGTLGVVMICILFTCANADAECRLPSAWTGNWYVNQRDNNIIKIDTTTINLDKNEEFLGTCTQRIHDDLFIFVNKATDCTKCVLIQESKDEQKNVLRYRESNCDYSIELKEQLCGEIYSDYYYLIRHTFDPIPCPFRNEQFLFTYLNSKLEICNSTKSHTESCYDNTQLVFKYDACYNKDDAVAKVEEIQCVALWDDGSHKYFVATVKESQNPSRYVQGKFRCFIYSEIRDLKMPTNRNIEPPVIGYNVSISEDASCAALVNPTSGIRSLIIYMTDKSSTSPPCSFPHWFNSQRKLWASMLNHLSINGTTIGSSEMSFIDRTSTHRGGVHDLGKFKCSRVVEKNGQGEELTTVILGREIIGCIGRDVCINLVKKTDYISEIFLHYKGEHLTQDEFESSCTNNPPTPGSDNNEVIRIYSPRRNDKEFVLIEKEIQRTNCPFNETFNLFNFQKNGKFVERNCTMTTEDLMAWHPEKMIADCDKEYGTITFMGTECTGLELVAECLGSWSVENRIYFMVSFKHDKQNSTIINAASTTTHYYCFTFVNDTTTGVIQMNGATGHCPSSDHLDRNSIGFSMQRVAGGHYRHHEHDIIDPGFGSSLSQLNMPMNNFLFILIVGGVLAVM